MIFAFDIDEMKMEKWIIDKIKFTILNPSRLNVRDPKCLWTRVYKMGALNREVAVKIKFQEEGTNEITLGE